MALGMKKFGALKSSSRRRVVDDGDLGLGLGFVRYKTGLGRKRVLISGEAEEELMFGSPIEQISPKRLCYETTFPDNGTSRLESLPQDVLVRVICGVEHQDLKQLSHVSKTVREATLIAKESYFAYTTPKKTKVFRGGFGSDEPFDVRDETEAPGAPMLRRYRRCSRISDKEVSGISMCLFT